MGTISASRQTSSLQSILVTALKNGSVQMWNTSTPTLRLVHQVDTIIYSFNSFFFLLFCNSLYSDHWYVVQWINFVEK